MMRIKKERFGHSLDHFKTSHEAPIVKLHMEIRAAKKREAKKLQNKEAMKANAIRKREKAEKQKGVARMDVREFKLQDQLKGLLQEEDLSMAQFMTSGDPRVASWAKSGKVLDNLHMDFDAFEAEAVDSDSWWSMGSLNAEFLPSRLEHAPGERWHWEKHLPVAEWEKVISSEILSCGLPLREDMQLSANTLDPINESDFETQGARLSPVPTTGT